MAYETDKKKSKKQEDGDQIRVNTVEGETKESYIPEGYDSITDFLQCMRDDYQADVDFDRYNRDAALEDKRFAAGEQWDPIVLEQRKGLPCLVINNIPQFTAQLVGDFREAKKGVKVLPQNNEDVDVANVRGDIIRTIEYNSRADRVYDSAFESLVQCGDGAYRVAVEYARDDVFDQSIFIRPIEDVHSTVWDRFSVDPTGRDAKRVFVDDRIPKKEFCDRWPEVSPDELLDDNSVDKVNLTGWVDDDSYRVTEYWRLIERKRLLGLFQNGKVFELDGDNMEELVAQNGPPIKTRVSWCSFAQMHLVTGFAILSGPHEYRLNRLPIIRMSGRVTNIGGRRVRFGLVRFLKDAARLKNFWRSVAAEQLGYAPKAKWIAPASAVEGREDQFRKAHLSRDPLLVYNDDAEVPPQLIPPPPVEASLLNEAAQNAQDMKDVTGIQDASLGIRSNEVSGRAIQARQREGDIASLTFYDNANAAILEGGDVINQLIPQVMDGTRVERLIGDDETLRFVRLNDPMDPNAIDLSVGMFDVALSTGPSYTTRRVEAAQSMMDAIQVFPQLMAIAGPEIIRAQEWPGADKIADKMEQMQGQSQIDPEMVQKGLQELQKTKEENTKLKLENQSLKVDKVIDAYNAETQRIRALSDNMVDGNQMEMDAIQMILNSSTKLDEHDMQRDQNDRIHEQQLRSEMMDMAKFGESNRIQQDQHTSTLAAKAQSDSQKKSQSRKSANG